MYTHELKLALLQRLVAIPEVTQVNYLQYWGEQIFFLALDPMSEAAQQAATNAVDGFLKGLGEQRIPRVRLRFFPEGQPLPSSATLYRKPTPTSAGFVIVSS